MLENNLKNLIKILEESNIDEMEVSTFWGKQKIRIRKNSKLISEDNIEIKQGNSEVAINNKSDTPQNLEITKDPPVIVESEISTPAREEGGESPETLCIKAPLVGTFYRSPKVGDPPFISEGDNIREGQIICIIEAMKIFNEIESEFSGRVENIMIKDSTPVEYDQDLIVISPE